MHLETALTRNGLATAQSEREIALLREYRTTLTAEVVTGKLDVREAAKHLPAIAEEPQRSDTVDTPELDLDVDDPE